MQWVPQPAGEVGEAFVQRSASSPVTIAATSGCAAALLTSIDTMRACA